MYKKIIVLVGLLVSVLALTERAGAAPAPCAISGSDQGWFWSGNRVMQCVIDENHMIIVQYAEGGVNEGVVYDTWIPGSAYYWGTVGTPYGAAAIMRMCPKTWLGYEGIYSTANGAPAGWDQRYYWIGSQTFYAGAVNHYKNWPTPKMFRAYWNFAANCPYGGSGTGFSYG